MGNPCFHFKQFDVYHDRCAMKVGTDGVLLGAWVNVEDVNRVLDVGTGSGLIALMLAQRTTACIDALEIDKDGAEQARINASNSPWSERLNSVCADAVNWQSEPYDLIVSNPPYYRNALKAPSIGRKLARHDDTLTWEQLVKLSANMLTPGGRLAVILPIEADGIFEALCLEERLFPIRRCEVSTIAGQPVKRLLFEFSTNKSLTRRSTLIIETADHRRTPEFSKLMGDFYL